jgi:predicted TIM-barrel fold metal-dependent hydrolase
MNYIDAHTHVWTSDTARYPLAAGWCQDDMRPPSFTADEFLRHARPAGVTRANLIQMSFYCPRDLSGGIENSFDNSYMLDAIARHPGVFVGTAVIDPHVAGVEERMRELRTRGVRAFRIHPRLSRQPAATWLRPEGYRTMFAAAAHTGQALSCLIDPDGLPEVSRMCTAYPDTTVIIDHLARVGVDGNIRAADVDALCGLARHARVLVKVGAFYALGRKQPPYTDLVPLLRRVIEAFGARRCMWESDCPFQVQGAHTYAASIDLVRRLDNFTEEDRDWLLRRTAEEFFFPR